ncbi:MAG: ribosome maturation factor RimM [Sphaerochaeta sp.]
MDRLIATATIGRTFGYEGEVRIYPNNEESAYLKKLKTVIAEDPQGRRLTLEIEYVRIDGNGVLMKFAGYDSSEKAQTIVGLRVLVDRELAAPLKDGEYYTADLIGCALISDTVPLATVVATMDGAQGLLLEVERSDSKRFLIPFLHVYTGVVDIEHKSIELLAPWLLD